MRPQPILISKETAAETLGIGLTKFKDMDKSGELGPSKLKMGTRTLWDYQELKDWVRAGMPRRDKWSKIRKGVAA